MRQINRHPTPGMRLMLVMLPFVLLLAAYFFGSAVRLEANPQDKLLPGLQQMLDEDQEQVCSLASAKCLREVVLDAGLLSSAERRVGEDDVDPVLIGVVAERPRQGVVVHDVCRHVDAMEQHVC